MSTTEFFVKPPDTSEVQSLTAKSGVLAKSVDWWNDGYVWLGALALLIAFFVYFAQWRIIRKSRDLSSVQADLIAAKDRELSADLKQKDSDIANANQKAADANERAKKAEEGTATAQAEAARATERAAEANKSALELTHETTILRQQNLATEGKIEGERKKRVDLAASLLPRDFTDQSGGITRLSKLPATTVVFEYVNEAEPRRMAEQIAFVFSNLGWKIGKVSTNDDSIRDGITVGNGHKMPQNSAEMISQMIMTRSITDEIVAMLKTSGIEATSGSAMDSFNFPFSTVMISVGRKRNHELEKTLEELGPGPVTPIVQGKNVFFFGTNRVNIPNLILDNKQ